ncbi:hypothetical protein DXG01_002184 [Tephrocybe rancida]|nr:hypothetical protein DXG01_002184 [Tephrocybe rancida]
MQDTPNQPPPSNHPTPLTPSVQQAPLVYYDEAGNPFFQDGTGRFVPCFQGPYLPPPPPMYPPGLPIPHAAASKAPPLQPLSSTSRPAPVIDPALAGLPPLPDSSDDDLSDGPTIAKARGYVPSSKVAGTRRKDKGKQRADPPMRASSSKDKNCASASSMPSKRKVATLSSDDDGPDEPESKCGRPRGAGNYTNDNTAALLDAVEVELPIGQRGWIAVQRRYSKWTRLHKRLDRTVKSLETKYKQLVKTTMPTGDGYCPPEVKRAHTVEALINEHVCTRDLDDDDFNGSVKHEHKVLDPEEGSDEDEIEILETPAPRAVRSAVIRRPDPLTSRHKGRVSSLDLVTKLTDTFDPASVRARDAECADRSYNNTQILSLTQQLHDLQNVNETLRERNSQLQDHLHDAERARDHADLQVEMLKLTSLRKPDGKPVYDSVQYSADHRGGYTRIATEYANGGYSTHWVTDPSESEKENTPPYPRVKSSRDSHLHHSRPHRRNSHPDPGPSHVPSQSRSRHRGTSPGSWPHVFKHRRDEEAFDQSMTIRPPSPFQSAMHGLANNVEPPHFSAAADPGSDMKDVDVNKGGMHMQEAGGDDEDK